MPLIKEQMQNEPLPQEMPEDATDEVTDEVTDDVDSEESPQFTQAVELAYQMVYSEEGSMELANAMRNAVNVPEIMSDMAYEVTQVAAEQANLPEEDLVMLAMTVLSEMGDVAEAAGVQVQASDVAQSFKLMVLRMFGELGFNTTELQQAMDAYTPDMINEAMAMADGGAEPQPEMMEAV